MIKYIKHLAQYVTILSLGPIGSILEKHFMFKKNCSIFDYILAIGMCMFTFFLWYLYRREKINCKNILVKELNDTYVVTIAKSKWNDLIVTITVKNVVLNSFICKTIYNPQYMKQENVKQIKWKKKLGVRFIIVEEGMNKNIDEINTKNFLFEVDNIKFRFFYSI